MHSDAARSYKLKPRNFGKQIYGGLRAFSNILSVIISRCLLLRLQRPSPHVQLKPEKFEQLPMRARPPPRLMPFFLDHGRRGYLSPEVKSTSHQPQQHAVVYSSMARGGKLIGGTQGLHLRQRFGRVCVYLADELLLAYSCFKNLAAPMFRETTSCRAMIALYTTIVKKNVLLRYFSRVFFFYAPALRFKCATSSCSAPPRRSRGPACRK